MRELLAAIGGVICLILVGFVAWSGIAPPFVWTNTRYAPGYSERKFKAIKLGASQKEVRSALGNPIVEFTNRDGCVTMIYSFRDKRSFALHYRNRAIFLSNNVVTVKTSFINFD